MDMDSSNVAVALLPILIMVLLYLFFVAVGFTVLYFIVRAALNNSKLNQNMDLLRLEIARMNEQLTRKSSQTSEDPKE